MEEAWKDLSRMSDLDPSNRLIIEFKVAITKNDETYKERIVL
jgi:hypothetical protein